MKSERRKRFFLHITISLGLKVQRYQAQWSMGFAAAALM
jgi:hypothetical protein